jgi:hypothetical protein
VRECLVRRVVCVQNAGMVASDGLSELERVNAQLDDRARSDPRLERYRVAGGGPRVLDCIPDGWVVSDGITHIAESGGWWPGDWQFPELSFCDTVPTVLAPAAEPPADPGVVWVGVGTVWERDWFFTPALRERSADAPLCGFSSQALWLSMVFPTEAAILEAFLVTYDELGIDESGMVDPSSSSGSRRRPRVRHRQQNARIADSLSCHDGGRPAIPAGFPKSCRG